MEQTESRGLPAGRKILRLAGQFARGRRGVAAVEFAMVAVPFFGLLCAIFETAFVYFVHEAFDNAVNSVGRQVLVNSFSSNTTPTIASFKPTFCNALPSFITCSKVTLNIQAYDSTATNFSTISTSDLGTSWYNNNQSGNVNLGQPGQIVVFQAFYPMPVYLSVLVATGSNGRGVGNFYSQYSSSSCATNTACQNPNGSGLVHAIFSTLVFRNEP